MSKKPPYFGILPFGSLFLVNSMILFVLSRYFPAWVPLIPMLLANFLFLLLIILSMFLMTVSAGSNAGFFRGFYLSTMVRLFFATAIILLFYKLAGLPKTSVYVLLGVYFTYMMAEVVVKTRWIHR